jgi:hypothetical protein
MQGNIHLQQTTQTSFTDTHVLPDATHTRTRWRTYLHTCAIGRLLRASQSAEAHWPISSKAVVKCVCRAATGKRAAVQAAAGKGAAVQAAAGKLATAVW